MKSLVLFLVLLITFSCQQGIKTRTAPKDLIPEVKMVEMVKDLILIEGHIAVTYKQIQSYHKIMSASSLEVFNKHNVSKERYTRSFKFYASDQEKISKIYADVLNDLNEDKGRLIKTDSK